MGSPILIASMCMGKSIRINQNEKIKAVTVLTERCAANCGSFKDQIYDSQKHGVYSLSHSNISNFTIRLFVIYCGINIVYMILVTILQPCTRVCI